MDYKKKYYEAQEWIKSIYSELSHEQQMEAEAFFPELKESEDEKIRKWLISQLKIKSDDTNFDLNIMIDKAISWLEKQGGQKSQRMVSAEAKEAMYDKPAWSIEDISKVQRICKYLDEAKKYYADITEVRDCIDWLKSLEDRVLPQPKQKWKQENTDDLTDFENAMMHIGESFFGKNAGLDPNDTNTIKEQANTLLGLVPSKDWSEEDEHRVRIR